MVFLVSLCILLMSLLIPPSTYYLWMRQKERQVWNLKRNYKYEPKISLIIATYNEAKVIKTKLENVYSLNYPEDKLEVIVVDSASTDGTLEVCREFLATHNIRFPTLLLSEEERRGKSHALNTALQYAKGEIIATSDADSFWEPDALCNAVSFFADSSVGAVTGRERLINLGKSIHTLSEGLYRKFYYTLRLGESKIHSTLIFQGELSLYKRAVFDKFEDKAGCSDDTGTVINIISKGYRCIFVPDLIFYDTAAFTLKGRLMLKSRRAQHLIAGVLQSLHFKVNGKLPIPLLVVLFNFYLHLISPVLFLLTIVVIGATITLYFSTFWFLLLLFVPLLLIKKLRLFLVSYFTSNIALIIGIIQNTRRKRSSSWRKIDEMRLGVTT